MVCSESSGASIAPSCGRRKPNATGSVIGGAAAGDRPQNDLLTVFSLTPAGQIGYNAGIIATTIAAPLPTDSHRTTCDPAQRNGPVRRLEIVAICAVPTAAVRLIAPKPMLTSADLRDLIDRAQTRDPTAISELYHRFAGLILRYLALRVAERELAQDLTQEVFIKVIYAIDRFEYRDEKAFLGWLYTIAGNVLSSHQRRRRLSATSIEDQNELIDQRSQADEHWVNERLALQQAMEQLTHDQQQVVALRFFADMSNSEIAGVLRRTEGAVKAIQHRALQSLHRILSREGEEPAPMLDGLVNHPYASLPEPPLGSLKPRSGD